MNRPRGSLIAGTLASMALHAAILLPWLLGGGATTAPRAEPPRTMVAVLPPLPAPAPEAQPQVEPPETGSAEPEPPATPPPAPPAETVSKPSAPPPPTPVETASAPPPAPAPAPPAADIRMSAVVEPAAAPESGPGLADAAPRRSGDADDGLPPMRIMWDSPKQLADVAAVLGMRVVAVTDSNLVAGEVPLKRPYKLEPFSGELVVYSNRVRTLPLSFFGAGLIAATDEPIAAYWVLVPEPVDRQFADLVRAALKRAGLDASQVQWVETRFALEGSGSYRLEIVQIHQERRT